jgi:alpha-D-ribose 1-methylphosphonate 5-triphosphate synthase subunit PhnL
MLSVRGLTKRFQLHGLGGKVIRGCEEVSFDLPPGEALALAGPSGTGKSTVLKCIYRTYLSSAGAIRYRSALHGEVDLATAPERVVLELRRREIGYVSQFLRVIPRVPALEGVMQPLLDRGGVPVEEARARAHALLDRLRLPRALRDASPATFSGGEQQRINVARSAIWGPRLLLLDEPTASLDQDSVAAVLDVLGELRRGGTTLVAVLHDPRLVEAIADRTYRTGGAEVVARA